MQYSIRKDSWIMKIFTFSTYQYNTIHVVQFTLITPVYSESFQYTSLCLWIRIYYCLQPHENSMPNCEQLHKDLQLSWEVFGDQITMELTGQVGKSMMLLMVRVAMVLLKTYFLLLCIFMLLYQTPFCIRISLLQYCYCSLLNLDILVGRGMAKMLPCQECVVRWYGGVERIGNTSPHLWKGK